MGFAGVALGCTGGRAARSGRRRWAGARRAARARTPRALRGLRGTRAHCASRHARGARAGARMAHRRRARGPAVRARIEPRRAGTRRASVDVGHHRQCRLRACKWCEHAASGQRPRSPAARGAPAVSRRSPRTLRAAASGAGAHRHAGRYRPRRLRARGVGRPGGSRAAEDGERSPARGRSLGGATHHERAVHISGPRRAARRHVARAAGSSRGRAHTGRSQRHARPRRPRPRHRRCAALHRGGPALPAGRGRRSGPLDERAWLRARHRRGAFDRRLSGRRDRGRAALRRRAQARRVARAVDGTRLPGAATA